MDRLKKVRTGQRGLFTKSYNKFLSELEQSLERSIDLTVSFEYLKLKYEEIKNSDEKMLQFILEADTKEDEIEKEFTTVGEFDEKFIKARNLFENSFLKEPVDLLESSVKSVTKSKKKVKLPKYELKKFSGDPREWVHFWGHFAQVHEDDELEDVIKFDYLLQAMTEGSRARRVVESYPPCGENYKKAIEALQNRFGRKDLLIEIYARELLSVVINKSAGNESSLMELYDKIESHLRVLETLEVTTDTCAAILYPMVESCLPEDLLRLWHRQCVNGNRETDEEVAVAIDNTPKIRLDRLMSFLRTEVENEEKVKLALSGFGNKRKEKVSEKKLNYNTSKIATATGLLVVKSPSKTCLFCEGRHQSHECNCKMSYNDKIKLITKNHLCFRCLKRGHSSKECKLNVRCMICCKKHFTVLCSGLAEAQARTGGEQQQSTTNTPSASTPSTGLTATSNTVIALQTIRVKLIGEGTQRVVRALFDSGSQKSYLLSSTASALQLKPVGEETVIHALFGGSNEKLDHKLYNAYIESVESNFQCHFQVFDQRVICGEIKPFRSASSLCELADKGIELSDTCEGPIELLIGADVMGKLITGKKYELSNGLVALHTLLGWTVMGKLSSTQSNTNLAMTVTSMLVHESNISDLWKLDVLGITDPIENKSRAELENEVTQHFLETVTKDKTGRYEVHMPWLDGHPKLGNNLKVVLKRLDTTYKRLKNENYYEEYCNVFQEWLSDGVIEEVPFNGTFEKGGHYLPHRAVIKEGSTTKVRPVFDASSHDRGCVSLNSCLEKGVNLIEQIPSILVRFRLHKYGIISDIKRAFLQISLQENDRDYLRFVWKNENGDFKVYRHCRVVFGVSCSPFLLGAVINYHLNQIIEDEFTPPNKKVCAEKLKQSFYVDNCVTSLDSEKEIAEFIGDSIKIMEQGKFDLRGWETTDITLSEKTNNVSSVLGYLWNRKDDYLALNMNNIQVPLSEKITKRTILSYANRVFDIVGYTCPVMLYPKILLQELWSYKIGWDEELPFDIENKFSKWVKNLHYLSEIQIPRWVRQDIRPVNESLHIFVDASQSAYAAVVFLRSESPNSGVTVSLIQAKSRVTPIIRMTIPRLELLAATIGVRLANSILASKSFSDTTSCYYWTDSSTVLAWISREVQWKTFVGNRVSEIKRFTRIDQWRHIPGTCNPADLPSRGCSAPQLLESKWWLGKDWLYQTESNWPKSEFQVDDEEVNLEKRNTVTSSTMVSTEASTEIPKSWSSERLNYFSSYFRIIKMLSWIFRFLRNARASPEHRVFNKEVTPEELDRGEIWLLRVIQKEHFDDLSGLKNLRIVTDHNGLLRVSTKLLYSEYEESYKFPILLPSGNAVVEKLIWEKHRQLKHAGVSVVMSELREKYWIVRSRKTIKKVLRECKICARYRARPVETAEAPLPGDRINLGAVFQTTGIDFAGPLFTKKGGKVWIALFTCAVYRSIHLELVDSLSTEAFLMALRRFVSRRGRVSVIYSDNGTNFVGASHLLDSVDWDEIERYSATHRITWKFIPPTAAWWGGWWERLVRVIKELLRKNLGRASLNEEEIRTLLCECESVVNSRPLTYVPEDAELRPLTPAMFLRDLPSAELPDLDSVEANSLVRRWRYLQSIREGMRERFRKEYLGLLVTRGEELQENISVGDVVLLGSDNKKRLDWPLALVLELYPGRDGVNRVAKIKTERGEIIRPVRRLYPLELRQELPGVATRDELPEEEERRGSPTQEEEERTVRRTRRGREIRIPERFMD